MKALVLLLVLAAADPGPADRAMTNAEILDKIVDLLTKTFEAGFQCGAKGLSHDVCMKMNDAAIQNGLQK